MRNSIVSVPEHCLFVYCLHICFLFSDFFFIYIATLNKIRKRHRAGNLSQSVKRFISLLLTTVQLYILLRNISWLRNRGRQCIFLKNKGLSETLLVLKYKKINSTEMPWLLLF